MTIDEIFAALPEEVAQDVHEYLVIDPVTRTITVPKNEAVFGVEIDSDSERKYFICPRYVGDKLDLAACFLSIKYRNANGEKDEYLVEDTAVNGEYVTFSWLISGKVVAYKGVVQFRFYADTGAGKDWGTTLAQGESLEGLEPDTDTVEAETSDVVTQLRAMVTQQTGNVEAVGAAQVAAVKAQGTASTQEAVEAIQAQGAATNASIPAEYTELEANVDRLTRDRAAAIVCQAEGTAIQVQDASNDPLQGLRIFGRSTQDGTPTPDAPVEIISTPAPVVTVCGKNLLDVAENFEFTGTPGFDVYLPAGEYTVSFDSETHEGEKPPEFRFYDNKIWNTLDGTQKAKTVTLHKPERKIYLYSNGTSSANSEGVSASVKKLMVSKTGGDYEPYTGQTLAVTTPGSLPGIPVASGGNYTDANGQPWICDEVDLARGVYVQRVKKFVLADLKTETWYTWGVDHSTAGFTGFYHYFTDDVTNDMVMSNIGAYSKTAWGGVGAGVSASADGNYFMVSVANANLSDVTTDEKATASFISLLEETSAYIMAAVAPAETPLTDVELQAFLALHSNKPTTTVLNDAGAHMVLEYAADPKTYIDNKLAALIAANN